MTLTREQKLTLIYRHTHRDFKGKAGPIWGPENVGKKTIMLMRGGGTCLALLDDLTDAEIADMLPFAMLKEHHRLEAKRSK